MAKGDVKLFYPGLAKFYQAAGPYAYTACRVVVGIMFLIHAWTKINTGIAGVSGFMARNGLVPGEAFAYTAIGLEVVGGVCLILGLFTRFFAAALAVEMAIALLVVHLSKGYAAGAGGYEYVLLIGVVCLAIAIRGGGPLSVDAKLIGKEL